MDVFGNLINSTLATNGRCILIPGLTQDSVDDSCVPAYIRYMPTSSENSFEEIICSDNIKAVLLLQNQ
jgi:hypothetical protein